MRCLLLHIAGEFGASISTALGAVGARVILISGLDVLIWRTMALVLHDLNTNAEAGIPVSPSKQVCAAEDRV